LNVAPEIGVDGASNELAQVSFVHIIAPPSILSSIYTDYFAKFRKFFP
jgi:hypothetical protein